MAFIRRRKSSLQQWSYQAIETYREGGKVHQRVLVNLGPYPGVDAALMGLREQIVRCEQRLSFCEEKARQSWRARREWNYSIKVAAVELKRHRRKLAQLESDIERLPQLRSVKEFGSGPKLSDTTFFRGRR